MDDRDRHRRRLDVAARLLCEQAVLPTSHLARLGRLVASSFRGGRLLRKDHGFDGSARTKDLATLDKIVSSLGELKGIAMKAGQILSYIDMALPDEARATLSALQTHSQPMAFAEVEKVVRRELGPRAPVLLKDMQRTPVAAASVGQVHRARLPDGTDVAVKVQYPDIDKAITNDFGPAAVGGRIATLIYPATKIDSFIREARARFLEECDYLNEAQRQQAFAEHFANHAVIRVPAVHSTYSSRYVLTTTFVEGMHLYEFVAGNPPQEERDRLGTALFEFYLGALFYHGLYNCDPHPGNFLFCPDGRLAILDYGCTRKFESAFVRRLAALTRAVKSDVHAELRQALLGLKIVGPAKDYDFDMARQFLRAFYGPMLEDKTQAFARGHAQTFREVTKNKKQLFKLALPGELLFLMRVRFGLTSVLASLGARANWAELERQAVAHVPPPPPLTTEHGTVGPTEFDVVLVSAGDNVIQLIRELRETMSIGIREAKDFAERVPTTITRAVDYERAEFLRQRLESAGGKVTIKAA